jgi:hypothetical protein
MGYQQKINKSKNSKVQWDAEQMQFVGLHRKEKRCGETKIKKAS